MPDLLLTPPAVDITPYAPNTYTITFQWPAGDLLPGTWTARLRGAIAPGFETLATSVSGDTVIVTIPPTTALLHTSSEFELAVNGQVKIGGEVIPTLDAREPTSTTLQVQNAIATVAVTAMQSVVSVGGGIIPLLVSQVAPVASRQIVHNRGRYPHVSVVVAGEDWLPDVQHNSVNDLTVTFAAPTAFDAVLI